MKVSIITVVFNNKAFIADCIQSVCDQTYPNIEHIVIDGGSTDGTQEKIEPFRDKLAYYISEKDEGLYDGLNKGILQATGDVVGVLHSDDMFYDNDVIEHVVKAFKATPSDVIYGSGLYVDQNNTDHIKRIYLGKNFNRRNLMFGWVPLHTTMYAKRQIFNQLGLYKKEFSIASDYEISLRWLSNPDIKANFMNENMVKMRLGGKSTTASLQQKKSSEDLKIMDQYGLPSWFTLPCKIGRKIPQYILPRILPKDHYLPKHHDLKIEPKVEEEQQHM